MEPGLKVGLGLDWCFPDDPTKPFDSAILCFGEALVLYLIYILYLKEVFEQT